MINKKQKSWISLDDDEITQLACEIKEDMDANIIETDTFISFLAEQYRREMFGTLSPFTHQYKPSLSTGVYGFYITPRKIFTYLPSINSGVFGAFLYNKSSPYQFASSKKTQCNFDPSNYHIDALHDEAITNKVNMFRNPMENTKYFQSRLIEIMTKHKTMYVDSDNKNDFNMQAFMKQFDETFEFVHVLDDFVIYLTEENRSTDYAEKVYNLLVGAQQKNKCDVASCICMKRNKDQSYAGIEPKDFAYHSAMDNIHVHLYHSFDLGLRLTQKEKEFINGDEATADSEISDEKKEVIRRRMREFIDKKARNVPRRNTKNNKFVTVIHDKSENQVTFRDYAMNHLAHMHRDREQNLYKIAEWIRDEKHDTDSLCEYIAFQEDAKLRVRINEVVGEPETSDTNLASNLKRFVVNNDPEKIYYSFGVRFFYWSFYKNNQNETNIIRKDMTSKGQRKWFDPGNTNYLCCEWYVKPYHDSIRSEALNSGAFDVTSWIAKQEEAKMKMKQTFCRRTRANDFWEIAYGIERDSALQLHHAVAIILYTHSSTFCYNFSRSFRKTSPFETDKSLKERHSRYHHTAKALRELIEAYGTQFAYSYYKTFYHGINCQMYFKTCYAKIAGPMSTTIDETVALGTFAGDKGIVLHLVNKRDLTFFIDCMKFSCFSNEQECLFLGGFAPIPFKAIKVCNTRNLLSAGIKIIGILTKMFSSTSHGKEIKKKQLKIMKKLIEHQANRTQLDFQINEYELDLFKCFCLNLEKIVCDMYLMSNKELFQGKEDDSLVSKLFGYNQIYDIFFNKDLDVIKLDLMLKLFPKLKRILIKSWITIKYAHSEDKAMELMKYVLDSLKTHLTMVHKIEDIVIALAMPMKSGKNTHCPKKHELASTITDEDGYFCDKCDKEFPQGTELFGCFDDETECDYCVCHKCYKTENLGVKYLMASIQEYKPKFIQEIGWNVGVAPYRDHLEHEFDAIWFTNNKL